MSARDSNTDPCLSRLQSQINENFCPECGGEGCFVAEGPGCFDERLGNYYPTDLYIACDRCGGTGEEEPEVEPLCSPNCTQLQTADDLLDLDNLNLDENELPF